MKTFVTVNLISLLSAQNGFAQEQSEVDSLKKIVASQQVLLEKMQQELDLLRREVPVVSTDYADPKLKGAYFQVWRHHIDRALDTTDWDGKVFKVRKKGSQRVYEVSLSRSRIGAPGKNSAGDAHGKLAKNPGFGQWKQGDVLIFVK